jgi:hypothetical protein
LNILGWITFIAVPLILMTELLSRFTIELYPARIPKWKSLRVVD